MDYSKSGNPKNAKDSHHALDLPRRGAPKGKETEAEKIVTAHLILCHEAVAHERQQQAAGRRRIHPRPRGNIGQCHAVPAKGGDDFHQAQRPFHRLCSGARASLPTGWGGGAGGVAGKGLDAHQATGNRLADVKKRWSALWKTPQIAPHA